MTAWRVVMAGLLTALLTGPLAAPILELLAHPAGWQSWRDSDRLADLAAHTLLFAGATVALAVPVGALLAVLLERSDLPGRQTLRSLTVLALFVPLPLLATAWQAVFGAVRPGTDLTAAIAVQALSALPWAIWLIGLGLRWVERDAEEDALLAAGPVSVWWRVTLPRARLAVAAAALWIFLLAAGDFTVTDLFRVRTFAEEVYSQFVSPTREPGGTSGLTGAVAVALPPSLALAALLLIGARRIERRLPPLLAAPEPPPLIRLGRWRGPAMILAATVIGGLIGVPCVSLLDELGQCAAGWSATVASAHLGYVFQTDAGLVIGSLGGALVVGSATATLALVAGWLAAGSARLRTLVAILAAVAWALPGPVIGLGMLTVINRLLDGEEWLTGGAGALRTLLYDGPSPLPVWWAQVVRFFPVALALLWPAVRLLPAGLSDAVRVAGGGPTAEFRHVVWPLARRAWRRAALAVAALALGEVSASKLVETPGGQTFAHEVFTLMHYGVTNNLAALGLIQMAAVALVGVVLLALERRSSLG